MNPSRPRAGTAHEVVRLAWYVLRRLGKLPRDLWYPIVCEAHRHVWCMALEHAQWEQLTGSGWDLSRVTMRMAYAHAELRVLVMPSVSIPSPYALPVYKYRYRLANGLETCMWRR